MSDSSAIKIRFLRDFRHVLKTNFYQPTKVALSFRLAPDFLPEVEYPKKPFGMFFIIGNDFRGFHIRFRDVARGGIRIVMSRNKECAYILPFFSVSDVSLKIYSGITQSIRGCCTFLSPCDFRLHVLN